MTSEELQKKLDELEASNASRFEDAKTICVSTDFTTKKGKKLVKQETIEFLVKLIMSAVVSSNILLFIATLLNFVYGRIIELIILFSAAGVFSLVAVALIIAVSVLNTRRKKQLEESKRELNGNFRW